MFTSMRVAFQLSGIFFLLVVASSCTTFNNMSTGRTLGKGKREVIPSLASFYAKGDLTPPILPQVIFNYGITETLDAGVNLSFGIFGVQSRLQIIGDQRSEFCGALGFSYTYFGAGLGSGEDEDLLDLSLSNLTFPLHLSWHPNNQFALYFSPKYSFLGGDASIIGTNSGSRVQLFGLTPGIEFGKKTRYIFEVNILDPLRTNENFESTFATISVGARFKW